MGGRCIFEAGGVSFVDRLRAAGIARPVAVLWFSTPRAAVSVVFGAVIALIGAGFVWSFHAYPDQIVHGRGAWMAIDHGMGGVLFGLAVAGGGIAFGARAMWRLATRRSAFAITPEGVLTERAFVGARLFRWDAIECVKVERNYETSPMWFTKRRMYATLALYPLAKPGEAVKPVKLDAMQIEGGLLRTCRFADTVDRVMGTVRAGKL